MYYFKQNVTKVLFELKTTSELTIHENIMVSVKLIKYCAANSENLRLVKGVNNIKRWGRGTWYIGLEMINHFNRDKIDAGRKNTTTDNTVIIDEYRAHLAPRVIELLDLIKYYRYQSYAFHYFIYSIISKKHSLLVHRLAIWK